MKTKDVNLAKLKAQYAVLSELTEYFPPDSKHKAHIKINKMMEEILSKIIKNK